MTRQISMMRCAVTADDEMTVETVRAHAWLVGLPLSDEDAVALVPGARRTRAMAEAVRRLVTPEVEPAAVFAPKGARE
jgi:hypothetical protein